MSTNAPVVADSQSTNAPKALHWKATWRGWEGLDLELSERTFIPAPTGRIGQFLNRSNSLAHVNIEKVKMTAHIGARLELDGAGYVTTGNVTGFDGGVQLRRALFSVGGDSSSADLWRDADQRLPVNIRQILPPMTSRRMIISALTYPFQVAQSKSKRMKMGSGWNSEVGMRKAERKTQGRGHGALSRTICSRIFCLLTSVF